MKRYKNILNKPELIAPAGSQASLVAAIEAGANSVYFGIIGDNMRAKADNFQINDINKVVNLCHKNKVKAYITLNSIIYDFEFKKINKVLKAAKKAKIDAVIAFDLAVIQEANKLKIPVHLSTQASISNAKAAEFFYKNLNIKRIVLARELNLNQIQEIKKSIPKLEIETFIHGAMCMAVSGRCYLSQDSFNKSANRGLCLQNCRHEYIVKDTEEDIEYEVENNYIFSSKDLCTIEFIDKLIEAGITAFKIEGRNKSAEYAKIVTECYREAIDSYFNKKYTKELINKLIKKLKTVYHRDFYSGFYLGKEIKNWQTKGHAENKSEKVKQNLGIVENYYPKVKAAAVKLQANNLNLNDEIVIIGNETGVLMQKVTSMQKNNKGIKVGKQGELIAILVNKPVRKGDKVYILK